MRHAKGWVIEMRIHSSRISFVYGSDQVQATRYPGVKETGGRWWVVVAVAVVYRLVFSGMGPAVDSQARRLRYFPLPEDGIHPGKIFMAVYPHFAVIFMLTFTIRRSQSHGAERILTFFSFLMGYFGRQGPFWPPYVEVIG